MNPKQDKKRPEGFQKCCKTMKADSPKPSPGSPEALLTKGRKNCPSGPRKSPADFLLQVLAFGCYTRPRLPWTPDQLQGVRAGLQLSDLGARGCVHLPQREKPVVSGLGALFRVGEPRGGGLGGSASAGILLRLK